MNQLELFPTTELNQETSASSAGSPMSTTSITSADTTSASASDPRSPIHNSKFLIHNSSTASVFDEFTDDQLLQIVDWLADHTYKQTRGLIKENYHRDISHGAIQRFFQRTSFLDCLDQSEQSATAAREILRNIVSNQADYSEATLRLLEQTAFNLALTSRTRPRDLDALNRINNIICRSRNTSVRERHATVQEKKTDLRTRELDLKTQIFQARLDGRLTPTPNRNLFSETRGNASEPITDAQNPAHPVDSVQDNSARPKIKILVDEDGEAFPRIPGPCPLPDDVIIKNRAYAKKLLAGLIDPDTGEELPAAPSSGEQSAELVTVLASGSPTSISRDEMTPSSAVPADPTSTNENPSALSASSADSASIPVSIPPSETQNQTLKTRRRTSPPSSIATPSTASANTSPTTKNTPPGRTAAPRPNSSPNIATAPAATPPPAPPTKPSPTSAPFLPSSGN